MKKRWNGFALPAYGEHTRPKPSHKDSEVCRMVNLGVLAVVSTCLRGMMACREGRCCVSRLSCSGF